MNETWLHVQSFVATGIYNLDSTRRRNASLETRTEGWTEVWGEDGQHQNSSIDEAAENDWAFEDDIVISRALSTTHPQMPFTLVQHRPAWFEQLVLRFSGVPHIVVNSPYVATEATGPLPYLRHVCEPQVLVGRHHPTATSTTSTTRAASQDASAADGSGSSDLSNSNCILDYLQSQGYVSLDKELSPSQKSLSNAYTALITSQLQPAILSLRFGDKDAWEQVYRQQYIRAASSNNGRSLTIWRLPPLGCWFQAWCVRAVTLKQLKTVKSVQECTSIARSAFESLETQLRGNNYLLHTEQPTIVDALLWANLADALCDVHLVTILADFPSLVAYFARIYDSYFRLEGTSGAEWKVWNQQQNLSSPFQQLPLEESLTNETTTFHDALELMQRLSVHIHDMQEVLTVVKAKRLEENAKERKGPAQEETTLYRWRMGGDIFPSSKQGSRQPDEEQESSPLQEHNRKVHKRNDQLWISSVLAVTFIALFFGATTRNQR